ncbi:MAG: PKD domain-containing protein [Bacteroidales bacterium]|jgi:gliding motility-associated-like protein
MIIRNKIIFTLFILLAFNKLLQAQMVGVNAYINGTGIEIGIDGAGGFEGANTTVSPPPGGMHFRSNTNFFGFVANPQNNGWATFDGDFFTPGTPENGWGVTIGNSSSAGDNCDYLNQIPGNITNYSVIGSCISVDWEGNLTTGTNLHFKINYLLEQTALFYTTTVSITNNTAATIPTLYYYRNLDPDNNIMLNGSYVTTNTIVSQPGTGGCDIAHVSATQSTPWNSYVGFAASGSNWRASYGGFSNRDGYSMWTGSGFTQTVGSSSTADIAIELSYLIQNLAPGATETFKFVVILSDADADQAINNLMYFTYPGSSSVTPSACTPYIDTVATCGGTVPISVSGSATTDYSWAWHPATGLSVTTGTSVIANPSVTTTYTVIGTPLVGCVKADTLQIVVKVNSGSLANITASANPICPGNSTTLTATGGTTYLWSSGLGTSNSVTVAPTSTTTYTVTATNAGCTQTTSITVNLSPNITVGISASANNICVGTPTTLTASGASTYSWSGGLGTANPLPVTPTSTTTYNVTGTNASGCTGASTITINVNPLPVANAGTNQIICQGQNVNLTASGGGTYLWSNTFTTQSINISPTITTTYTVTVTSTSGCTADADVTVSVNTLPHANAGPDQSICTGNSANLNASGGNTYAWSPVTGLSNSTISNPVANPTTTTSYIVTVTDLNGCSAKDTMVLTVNPLLTVSAGANQAICTGQSASLNATGGINYIWSPSTGLSNSAIANPIASPTVTTTYTVTVADLHGCSNTGDVVITVNPIPTSSFTATSPLCAGQSSSTIVYTGSGTAGASYFWDFPGGTVISGSGQGPYQVSWSTPSTYNINLTVVENGCTSPVTIIPVVVGKVTATVAVVDSISCNGASDGQVIVTPVGTSPYQCNWSNSQISPVAINLSANIVYTVTVTDANGCSATQSITLTQPHPLAMAFTTQPVSCFNGHNGIANVLVSGGTHSYTYSWLPSGTGGNTNIINTLQAGTYTLNIHDLHGCTLDTTFVIKQPPLLTYSFIADSATCNNEHNGTICFHPSGGTSPYAYTWNPNVSSDSCATNIAAGNYLITVTDHNGCDTVALATVGQPQQIILHVSSNVTICIGQSTVISANATGGISPYTFTWNNSLGNGSSFTVSPTVTTTYIVTVTDHNNCSGQPLSVTVTVDPPISVSLAASPSSFCFGGSSIITATASGGNGLYTYTWGQGIGVSSAAITITPTATTWYPVTVTDNCGSPQAVDSVEIFVYPMPVVQFSADTLSGCEPLGVNFTDLSTPAIATWLWDFDDPMSGTNNTSTLQNPYHLFSSPGVYSISLTVTTTDSCSGSYTHNSMIEVYITPVADFSMYPQPGSTALAPDILFEDLSVNAYTWDWNFGDPSSGSDTSDIKNPEHSYNSAGTFIVTLFVESIHGCKDSVSKEVQIKQDVAIYYPNAFTPNGDAYNPGWRPEGTGIDNSNYKCYIYDRWGKMIWKTNDFYAYWDGHSMESNQACELGVYSYVAFVTGLDGRNYQFSGSITLVK